MKKRRIAVYGFWILATEAVGALSAWLTREDMRYFQDRVIQPPLSPPAILFPIVWGILYLLMGVGMARVVLSVQSRERTNGMQIYLLQLAVNFIWSIVFFHLRSYLLALAVLMLLLGLILWMIHRFRQVDKPAARLQIPYLLWVCFAAYLNAGIYLLNR